MKQLQNYIIFKLLDKSFFYKKSITFVKKKIQEKN